VTGQGSIALVRVSVTAGEETPLPGGWNMQGSSTHPANPEIMSKM
jgi:hypothetical protein